MYHGSAEGGRSWRPFRSCQASGRRPRRFIALLGFPGPAAVPLGGDSRRRFEGFEQACPGL
jgi:hypothetical protein